jgi:hypothetical protein
MAARPLGSRATLREFTWTQGIAAAGSPGHWDLEAPANPAKRGGESAEGLRSPHHAVLQVRDARRFDRVELLEL